MSDSLARIQASNAERARLVVEALLGAGVELFFVCPGARSTALVCALGRLDDDRIERVVLHDERTAGFAAVGAARAGRRAVVITTSGTAVANLAPAMTEAAVAHLPIVVVTADRPWELHGLGANQTVPQAQLFAHLDVARLDLPAPPDEVDARQVTRQLKEALSSTTQPAHINARFRKPLAPPTGVEAPQRRPAISAAPVTHLADAGDLDMFVADARRGLVVAGELPLHERDGARALISRLGWPTVADITSGVDRHVPPAFARRRPAIGPDKVLWLGGRLTEPAVARWLKASLSTVLQLDARPGRRDPDGIVDRRVKVPLAAVPLTGLSSTLDSGWVAAMADAAASWEPVALDEEGITEPAVARAVVEQLAGDSALVLGASMPVRDADRFARRLGAGALIVANRGASGIDGQLGTALGVCLASGRPTTALLGDLTFLHDVGGLVALKQRGARVRLVVVNNDGGGIFSLLPLGGAPDLLDPWFSAPHGQSAASIAEAFGLATHRPTSTAELEALLARPVDAPELIEISTNRADNAALHQALDARHGAEVRR